jgi:hypothetical protein
MQVKPHILFAVDAAAEGGAPVAGQLPSRPSSSPAWAMPEARASEPVRSSAAGTAGAVVGSGHGFSSRACPAGVARRSAGATRSVLRTQDGTMLVLDRRTGRAVSAATRVAAEAGDGLRSNRPEIVRP